MAKAASLVCQFLENINRDALARFQRIIRQYVRHRHGVYALYRRGKLQYVGLASNLQRRLQQHLRSKGEDSWDRFSVYLTIGDKHLRELESLILRIVRPSGNQQRGKFAKCENLKRRFAGDIRKVQRDELIDTIGRKLTGPAKVHLRPAQKAWVTRRAALHEAGHSQKDRRTRKPVLAQHTTKSFHLRAPYKGDVLKASVRRDGLIRFGGRLYSSPSLAGAAAVRRRGCNGWIFWRYERAPGDWVLLDKLRKP
jgi:hypothetical protein